jgi:hypothetical protein
LRAITFRREADLRMQGRLVQWQTQVLASFLASTVPDAKAARALSRAAGRLELFPADESDKEDRVRPGSYEQLRAGFGGGDAGTR